MREHAGIRLKVLRKGAIARMSGGRCRVHQQGSPPPLNVPHPPRCPRACPVGHSPPHRNALVAPDPRVKPAGSPVTWEGYAGKPPSTSRHPPPCGEGSRVGVIATTEWRRTNLSPPLHPPAYSPHSPTTPAGSREPACGRQMGEGGVRLPLGPWALCRPKRKRLAAPEFQKTHRMRRGGVSNISKLMRPVSPHATQSRPPAGLARRRFRTPIFPAITAPPHCPASDKLVDRSGCDQIGSFPLRIGPTTS